MNHSTPHYALPLPHPENDLEVDVLRLRNALQAVDAQLNTAALALAASAGNQQTALNNLAADVVTALASKLDKWTISSTSSNKTLQVREFCAVLNAGLTITLPADPSPGDAVCIAVGNFTDTLVARNGQRIMELNENMSIDRALATVSLMFVSNTLGWRLV